MNPTKTNTPTKTELSQLCNQTKTRNREKFDFRPILNGAAYFRRHLLENDETVILDIFTWPVIRPILNGAAYFRRHLLENDETVILDIFTWPVIFIFFSVLYLHCVLHADAL